MDTLILESIYTSPRLVKPIARKANPNQTESVYFILTDTKSELGKMIQKVLNVDYNHICFSFEDNFNEVYAFGTNVDEMDMGFIIERFDAGMYRIKNAEYQTMELKVTKQEKERIRKNLGYYIENKGKMHFNTLGLITNAIGIKHNSNHALFCSQFISKLLQDSGIKLFDKDPSLVRPSDFLFHPSIKFKHKGFIKDRLNYEIENNIRKQAFLS